MTKSLLLPMLIVVFLVQLAVPLSMIARREHTLRHGEAFKFSTAPVDPADMFRGRYVSLSFTEQTCKPAKGEKFTKGQKVFVSIGTGTNGFARFTGVHAEKPSEDPYISMRARYTHNEEIHFDIPYDRYYMNEHLAPAAERAYRENVSGQRDAYAIIRIRKGFAVIEDLYVGGMPIVEFIENQE